MKRFLCLLIAVLVSLLATIPAQAGERVKLDVSLITDSVTIDTSGLDRSLNPGKDAFRVFCDHAKRITPRGSDYGCSANTRSNVASFFLWDHTEYRPTGETFDLFNGRTVRADQSGVAFSANVRIATGGKWRATAGYSQGRTTTIFEEAFRDYARLDTQEPRNWFYDSNYVFGGGFHSLDWLYLSRHYREESATLTYRSRTLSIGGEYRLYSRGRVDLTGAGGVHVQVNRARGEQTVQDFDYTRFYPEGGIFFNERYSGRSSDYHRPSAAPVTRSFGATDVQLVPYLGTGVEVRVYKSLGVTSTIRWHPSVRDVVQSQESILGPYDVTTRPERFTFAVGATAKF